MGQHDAQAVPWEKSRDCPTLLKFGHFPFGIVFLLVHFLHVLFVFIVFTALPQPPPGSGEEDGSAQLLPGKGGPTAPGLLQALGRFCWQRELSLSWCACDSTCSLRTSHSSEQEQKLALWSRGPKCCHALFCSRETCNVSVSLPLWCPGRRRPEGWSKHRPRVRWGQGQGGTRDHAHSVSFLTTIQTGALTIRSFLLSSQSLLLG